MKTYFMGVAWVLLSFFGLSCLALEGERARGPAAEQQQFLASALEAVCGHLVATGFDPERSIHLRSQPQPIVDFFALHLLKEPLEATPEDMLVDEKLSQAAFEASNKTSVEMPSDHSLCRWKFLDSPSSGEMVVEFSPIVTNPYALSPTLKTGVFVKVSLSVVGGDWFWVVRQESQPGWDFRVVALDIDEN